jgi:hypothetical protein
MTRADHIRRIELQIEALVGHVADLKRAELLQADDRPGDLLGRLSHKLDAKRGSLGRCSRGRRSPSKSPAYLQGQERQQQG